MRKAQASGLAQLALGAALAGHGAADAKTEDLAKVRMTGPDPIAGASAEAARAQGKALLKANNVTQALQAYRQALAQDPESIEALNGIAVCFDRLGRYEDARLHYEAALGIDPTSPMLLNNYGLSLFLQGDRAGAERFLRLAAAAGDPDVQAASLRVLARMEREAPARTAPVRTAEAETAPAGPTIVRTSGHEQRLVLVPAKSAKAPVQLAAALPPERAMLAVPVGALSADEDFRIAAREQAEVQSEEIAAARAEAAREAARLMADARAAVPADMQVAALLKAAREAAAARDEQDVPDPVSPGAAEVRMIPAPTDTDWHRDQILVALPVSHGGGRRSDAQASMRMALLAAGFAPPRPAQREALVAAAIAALGNSSPRRSFPQAFASDDGRLNGFAARVQGTDDADDADEELSVAEKVARLTALIERVKQAA
jgi:Flp pilus assembly protein TadD